MSIEVTVICDRCGRVMDSAKTAAKARAALRRDMPGANIGLPGGRDECMWCALGQPHPESLRANYS